MLIKMASMEAESTKRQAVAVETMVKTSYRILGIGGMFMLGMFTVMSPLLKSQWKNDTIDEVERRRAKAERAARAREGHAEDSDEGTGTNVDEGTGVLQGTAVVKGIAPATGKVTVVTCSVCAHKTADPATAPAEGKGKGDQTAQSFAVSSQSTGLAEEKGVNGVGRSVHAEESKGIGSSAQDNGLAVTQDKVVEPSAAAQGKGAAKK